MNVSLTAMDARRGVLDLHGCELCKDWTRTEFSMSCVQLVILTKIFPAEAFLGPKMASV